MISIMMLLVMDALLLVIPIGQLLFLDTLRKAMSYLLMGM